MKYLSKDDLKKFRNMVDLEIEDLKEQIKYLEFNDPEREKLIERFEEDEKLYMRIAKEWIAMPEEKHQEIEEEEQG